jgi:hypothetical protein
MRGYSRSLVVVVASFLCGTAAKSQNRVANESSATAQDVRSQMIATTQIIDRIAALAPLCAAVANCQKTGETVHESPRIEQAPLGGHAHGTTSIPKAWKMLTLASGTAVTLDMAATKVCNGVETDPLAKPIVGLPGPAYFAVGYAEAGAADWLGLRMYRSSRWHRLWWIPQTLQIGGNLWGYQYTTRRCL